MKGKVTVIREHVRSELRLQVLKTVRDFKSQLYPKTKIKISDKDMIHVLSSIISRRTE